MHSLNVKLYPLYMNLKNSIIKYKSYEKELESKKEEQKKECENSEKEVERLRENQNKMKEEMEKTKNDININNEILKDSINETKLKNELGELKNKNELEKTKFIMAKDLEKINLENECRIQESMKETQMCEDAKKKNNELEIIKLKYECLKDKIYNDKEFDELIDIAKKRKDEIINDELEDIKEQKNDLEDFKKQSKKRLDNLKEKNNAEIQKKQIELQNHKLREYNKLLLEKKKKFNDFKNKFSGNPVSNENLKNKEIEKAKMYFEQQKNILLMREQVFQQQKQNINTFVKQLEMNDDEYSKKLLNYFKKK